MATTEPIPSFYDLVDELREALYDADAMSPSELHSFRALMAHRAEILDGRFPREAYEHLDMLGHIGIEANGMGGDCHARLSAS